MPTTPRRPLNLRYHGVILPAVGPCMFLAPVVFLVGIVGILCWPFVVVAAVPLWLLMWPLERALVALGMTRAQGLFDGATRVMRLVAKPWTYYDVPAGKATPTNADAAGPATAGAIDAPASSDEPMPTGDTPDAVRRGDDPPA